MRIRTYPAGRETLARLFKGVGAEIGVEAARFSKEIAEYSSKLYLIDIWKNYPGYREHVTDEHYERILTEAVNRMSGYNCEFIRKPSTVAAKDFEDESLDFVYLDANHEYEHLTEDLHAWVPKVRNGGIVAGHDYVKRKSLNYGVIKAVNEFCEKNGIDELTIWNGDRSPSWHFIKQ